MAFNRFVLLAVLLLAGCGKAELQGKIYIITGAQQTVPLADTEIQLFDESKSLEALKQFENERAEFNEKFQVILPLINKSIDQKLAVIQAQAPLSNIDSSIEIKKYILENSGPELSDQFKAERSEELSLERSTRTSIANNVERLKKDFYKTQESIDELLAKQSFYNNPRSYIKNLESKNLGIKVRTDSDGNFTITLPNPGKYLIAAYNQRETFGKTESYEWLFWTTAEKRSTTKIDITNRNLHGTNCDTCFKIIPIKAN